MLCRLDACDRDTGPELSLVLHWADESEHRGE